MMEASVFLGKQNIKTQHIEIPVIGDYDVRIRVKAAGICGTDIHIFNGEKGSAQVTPPVVLGHEFAGEVVEIGRKVSTVKVGNRITVDPNIYCGKCLYCKGGKRHLCNSLTAIGVNLNGGFAEYNMAPEKQVHVLEDDIDYVVGAMAEPLACCIHGVDLATIKAGDTVCIIGGGMIGQLMIQLAKLSGASNVILSEPVYERREIALKLGADYAYDPLNKNVDDLKRQLGISGVDVVIECAGVVPAIEQAFDLAKKGATIVLFSVPGVGVKFPLDLLDVFQKELTIKGSFVNPNTQQRAVNLINSGKVSIKPLITHEYGLDEVENALQKQTENDSIKVIIKPQ